VSRHRSGEPLRALGAGDLGPEFYTPADDEVAGWSVSFSVRVWRGCDLAEPAAPADAAPHGGPGAPGEGLGAATRGPALEEAEVIRAVERLYGWRYPHQALTEVPAKLSVTEASKLMSPPSEDDASPLWEEGMKRLLRQARGTADGVSPAERG